MGVLGLKIVLNKGVAKPNGMFIWGVYFVGKTGSRLPAGTVLARSKSVAMVKAKAMVRKRFR